MDGRFTFNCPVNKVEQLRPRKQAATLVKGFRDGLITNDDLQDFWPYSKNGDDRALRDIYGVIWCYYDDFHTHKFVSEPEVVNLFDRCFLFLDSELEYQWKRLPFKDERRNFSYAVRKIASLFSKPEEPESPNAGDPYVVWPFFTEAELVEHYQKERIKLGTPTHPKSIAEIVAYERFSRDQRKAEIKNFIMRVEERDESFRVSISPKYIKGDGFGGGNQYGKEVNYYIKKDNFCIIRRTFAR